MPVRSSNDVLVRLIKDVNDIRVALRRSVSNLPLYDINNENTPAQITANQNNYAPGNYDVLRLNTDASRTISGIADGVKGRALQIINVGNFNIILPHESILSTAENRFNSPSAESTVLYPRASVRLYYDGVSLRWSIPDAPTWMGTYGVSFSARYTAPQNIPSGVTTQITDWTVTLDDWSMFNAATQKITIPYTGVYIGVLAGSFDANANGYRGVSWNYETAGTYIMPQRVPNIGAVLDTYMASPMAWKFNAGDVISVACQHDAGIALNFAPEQWFLSRMH